MAKKQKQNISKRILLLGLFLAAIVTGTFLVAAASATSIGSTISTTSLTAETSITVPTVTASTSVTSPSVTASTSVSTPTLTSTNSLVIKSGTDTPTGIQFQSSAGTSTMVVDTLNSRIGIGTSSPAEKLEVEGNLKTECMKYAAWQTVNTNTSDALSGQTNTNDNYTGVTFVNSTTGYAVRNDANFTIAKVVKSTNAGTTWQEIYTLPEGEASFNAVAFSNTSTGVAVGNNGTFARTTNSGTTFGTSSPLGTSTSWNSIAFAPGDTGIGIVVGSGGVLGRTTDRGATWATVASGVTTDLLGIVFADANTIIAVGAWDNSIGTTILRSTNSGTSWSRIPVGQIQTQETLESVAFVSSQIGVAVGFGGTIVRTTDGGQNWTTVVSNNSETLYGIAFLNATLGIAIGGGGSILRTTDAGVSWHNVTGNVSTSLLGLAFVPGSSPGTVVVVGSSGETRRSTDGGLGGAEINSGGCLDIAELYEAGEKNIHSGMLVTTIKENGKVRVRLSQRVYDPQLLGVISSQPAVLIEGGSTIVGGPRNRDSNKVPVALAGRVPVRVNLQNGHIEAGDPITSSDTPGIGMKATQSGKIIGFALEEFDGENDDSSEIFVSVHTQIHVPVSHFERLQQKVNALEKLLKKLLK